MEIVFKSQGGTASLQTPALVRLQDVKRLRAPSNPISPQQREVPLRPVNTGKPIDNGFATPKPKQPPPPLTPKPLPPPAPRPVTKKVTKGMEDFARQKHALKRGARSVSGGGGRRF